MPSCASPLPLQLRHPPPHRSCSCYAILRRLRSTSPSPIYGHGNTINNLAMGLSKDPWLSKTSVPPVKRRKSPRHMEDTTLATDKGTPLPLFVQTYVSSCTVFIPQKTLVDRFFLILDVLSNSRCTRFLLIYYFTLARGPSPP